jgi:hypothetical protein
VTSEQIQISKNAGRKVADRDSQKGQDPSCNTQLAGKRMAQPNTTPVKKVEESPSQA